MATRIYTLIAHQIGEDDETTTCHIGGTREAAFEAFLLYQRGVWAEEPEMAAPYADAATFTASGEIANWTLLDEIHELDL